jgi:hypothetical protein
MAIAAIAIAAIRARPVRDDAGDQPDALGRGDCVEPVDGAAARVDRAAGIRERQPIDGPFDFDDVVGLVTSAEALTIPTESGGVVPSERAEIQVRSDRATGTGELVKFGEVVWYRFSFKIAGDWPHDVPVAGRQLCRTVIHQIKQDSFNDGKSCDTSPFFKIEARPVGEHVHFFAQVATGTPCDRPPTVKRMQICQCDLPRESWITVHVRLNPAYDASGQVDIWLNGSFCGSYQGPMADRDYGVRRNGTPFINAQPRFGIYRDWRAETQTIYFDKIMFWNADPSGHPDWGVSSPPG